MLLLFPGSVLLYDPVSHPQTPQALVGSIFVAFSLLRTFFLVPDSPLG